MPRTPLTGTAIGLTVAAVALTGLSLSPAATAARSAPSGASGSSPSIDRDLSYEVTVRRTEGGVPNIKADDYASLGYGTGYAMAEDNICMISDLVITFAAERARRLDATPANIASDSFYQLFIDRGAAEEELEERQAKIFRGAAAGFNRYLRDTGVDNLTDPACKGAEWLRPITEMDLRRISRMPFFLSALSPQFLAAAPPTSPPARRSTQRGSRGITPDEAVNGLFDEWRGSNGVAIGREATAGETGMLLANPHLSWNAPSQRMYALHQTIPGEMNMTGATTMGRIQVAFGATEDVAWTSTVSTARDYTFYRLDLVPGKPTHYYFDGEERAMTQEVASVQVPDGVGGHTTVDRTFFSTHYGARLVGGPGFTWDDQHAYAVRSIDPAWRGVDSLNDTWKAESVEEFADTLVHHQAMTTNVMAVDSSGRTYYTDANPIPYVTDAQREVCSVPGGLDGSRSACMWQSDPTASQPGTFGPDETPHLFRDDFVSNMNDSHWLANPKAPLTGYDGTFGATGTERTLRTRGGLHAILSRLTGTDGAAGDKFTLRGLQRLMFDNTSYTGVISRNGMVELCEANPQVTGPDGTVVDIGDACEALRGWDLRDDLGSRGAHLFREIMVASGNSSRVPANWNFLVPFDPADPVNTPRDLDPQNNPAVLQAIAAAVTKLRAADIALDARLGDLQYVTRNGERIPMHGGTNASGLFNIVNAPFNAAAGGYPDVTAGASWIQASEYRRDGLVSKGVLAFSQSTNPNSPHYADMTKMYSKKQWVDLPMSESDVAASTITKVRLTEDSKVCLDGGWRDWQSVDFDGEAQCVAHYDAQRAERVSEYDARHGTQAVVHTGKPVRINGKARVGQRLRVAAVSPRDFSPTARHIAYQWERDGVAIPHATTRAYLVRAADVGSRLTVRVTATTASSASGFATSNGATARRAAASIAMRLVPGATPRTLLIKATVKSKAVVSGRTIVTVLRNGAVLHTRQLGLNRDGRVSLTLAAARPGRYSVTLQYLGSDSVTPARATRTRNLR